MKRIQFEKIDILEKEEEISHFITHRTGGCSEDEYSSLNLSFFSGDKEENVINNRKLLANKLGIKPEKLIFSKQSHQTKLQIINSDNFSSVFDDTDALITKQKGLFISVILADCVPILLFDKKNKVIAAVHSGWRGTVAGILPKTIKSMNVNFETLPQNIIAGVGPAIHQHNYEIGQNVIDELSKQFDMTDSLLFKPIFPNKGQYSQQRAIFLQLIKAGVPSSQIQVSSLCTFDNSDMFFSARRADKGRFAAGIMLK